jgi:tRNA(fMet)-specific endonuclease VapC
MAVVVDTDVLSFIFKEDTRSSLYQVHLKDHICIISFQTVAELKKWPLTSSWGERKKQKLTGFLKRYIVRQSDDELCDIWAKIMDAGRRKGREIETADAWIAATALLFNVPLITHNHKDFIGVDGLTIISES